MSKINCEHPTLIYNPNLNKLILNGYTKIVSPSYSFYLDKEKYNNVFNSESIYFSEFNILDLCKSFINDYLPSEYEISKVEQAELFNRSKSYFQDNKIFDTELYGHKVFEEENLIKDFKSYKGMYENELGTTLKENFLLHDVAIKQGIRKMKNIIHLDKNFTIQIHGDRKLIECGEDENRGMKYYKIYFEKEI